MCICCIGTNAAPIDIEEDSGNVKRLETFEEIGVYLGYGTLGTIVAFWIIGFGYHKYCVRNGAAYGNVKLLSVVKFLQSSGDFWTGMKIHSLQYIHFMCHLCARYNISKIFFVLFVIITITDVLFAYVLNLQQYEFLSALAFIFTAAPFSMSCSVGIYFIIRWRRWQFDNPVRLSDYLKRYEILLCLWTILGGFYASVDLARSRLFYKRYFDFPLRKKEFEQLKHFKFINIVLLESVPQFGVQIAYLLSVSSENRSVVVYFSLLFTVVSLMFQAQAQLLRVCKVCDHAGPSDAHKQFTHKTNFQYQFTLESPNLRYGHTFANRNIEKCLKSIINTCNDKNLWINRDDISYDIEVYYISERIYTLREMDIYFELIMLNYGDPNTITNMINKMKENIESLSVIGSANYATFVKALSLSMKFSSMKDLKIKELTLGKFVQHSLLHDNTDDGIPAPIMLTHSSASVNGLRSQSISANATETAATEGARPGTNETQLVTAGSGSGSVPMNYSFASNSNNKNNSNNSNIEVNINNNNSGGATPGFEENESDSSSSSETVHTNTNQKRGEEIEMHMDAFDSDNEVVDGLEANFIMGGNMNEYANEGQNHGNFAYISKAGSGRSNNDDVPNMVSGESDEKHDIEMISPL